MAKAKAKTKVLIFFFAILKYVKTPKRVRNVPKQLKPKNPKA